jgi:hypothetical protein
LGTATAPEGVWKVIITNSADAGLRPGQQLQAWIQWDDVIYGYSRRGRQSYFEAEHYRRFDAITGDVVDVDDKNDPCVIRRGGLINAIATGHRTIVIGAVQQKDLRPPKYAAGGPITPTRGCPPHRGGPDAACVSDDSRIHTGILAAGSRSGSAAAMSGTSVAVPQIVRLIADMLAKGNDGDRKAICRFAEEQEDEHKKKALAASTHRQASIAPLDTKRCGAGRIVRPRRDWPNRYEADT